MIPLEKLADKYIASLEENGLLRGLQTSARDGITITRGNNKLISFSCNDYLGLSQHPALKKAAADAIEKYGVGSGASRFVTGNNPLYNELESRLAHLKGTEDAIVFGSGYLTNIGIIPAIAGRSDLILADKFVHACLIDGAQLSGAKLLRFEHNNVQKCEEILKKQRKGYKNCVILTDGVFSMDGDIAPVDELCRLAKKYNAWLITDDAHGLGVLNNGIGSSPNLKPHIQMGTLSKAVGGFGGYVCTSKKVADFLRNKSRSLIYSTALPPMVLAAAIAAIDIITSDKELIKKPLENARYFTEVLGLPEAQSPIVPLILGEAAKAIEASKMLEANGFLVSAIRPPTVPQGTARLRFTFSALHNREEIGKLAEIIKRELL